MESEFNKKDAKETDAFYSFNDKCDKCKLKVEFLELFKGKYLCNKCLPEDLRKNQKMIKIEIVMGEQMNKRIDSIVKANEIFWLSKDEFIIDSIRKHFYEIDKKSG